MVGALAVDAELLHLIEEGLVVHFQEASGLLMVPGIERKTAWTIMAEIGVDLSVFPDARHLASWAGLCPGNCESAGKRMSGRTRKANRYRGSVITPSSDLSDLDRSLTIHLRRKQKKRPTQNQLPKRNEAARANAASEELSANIPPLRTLTRRFRSPLRQLNFRRII